MLLSSFRGRTMTTRWHGPAPTEQGRSLGRSTQVIETKDRSANGTSALPMGMLPSPEDLPSRRTGRSAPGLLCHDDCELARLPLPEFHLCGVERDWGR